MEKTTKSDSSKTTPPTAEQQLFVGTVLSLSWQLLIVVVVPFLGGHFLDERYDSSPWFTLAGLLLALTMAVLVTYRGYQTLEREHNKTETTK